MTYIQHSMAYSLKFKSLKDPLQFVLCQPAITYSDRFMTKCLQMLRGKEQMLMAFKVKTKLTYMTYNKNTHILTINP